MFAAVTMQLDLNANGTTCTVQVNTGSIITTSGTCSSLTISISGGDHGELTVATKTGLLFGGVDFNSTSDGHDFVTVPQLQNQDQTQAISTSASGFFRTSFTDTSVPTVAPKFGVTTTLNALTLGGTGDFFAFNDNTNGIPATNLIGTVPGQAGPSSHTNNVYANPSPGTPYSLTTEITIHFLKKNQAITASQQISAVNVPEPASLMLMGSMLLLTSLGLRRKMTRG
jgi:hypothetical protein